MGPLVRSVSARALEGVKMSETSNQSGIKKKSKKRRKGKGGKATAVDGAGDQNKMPKVYRA